MAAFFCLAGLHRWYSVEPCTGSDEGHHRQTVAGWSLVPHSGLYEDHHRQVVVKLDGGAEQQAVADRDIHVEAMTGQQASPELASEPEM